MAKSRRDKAHVALLKVPEIHQIYGTKKGATWQMTNEGFLAGHASITAECRVLIWHSMAFVAKRGELSVAELGTFCKHCCSLFSIHSILSYWLWSRLDKTNTSTLPVVIISLTLKMMLEYCTGVLQFYVQLQIKSYQKTMQPTMMIIIGLMATVAVARLLHPNHDTPNFTLTLLTTQKSNNICGNVILKQ